MKFSDWVESTYPSFEDKLVACQSELINAANIVDIDYLASKLTLGVNKGRSVKVNSKDSQGRCRVYINEKQYDGMTFPHVVFLNLRQSFQGSDGKATPSVINSTNILFDLYSSNATKVVPIQPKALLEKKEEPSREILINEQRQWFGKLSLYSTKRNSKYLKGKGLSYADIVRLSVDLRMGKNTRYGKFVAIPLRYPHQETFQGMQRIFDTGEKIMVRNFNPNGLCIYISTPELRECHENAKIMTHEGAANALMAQKMCLELGVNDIIHVACLYIDNLGFVVDIIMQEMNPSRVVCLHDNDVNEVGKDKALIVKKKHPSLILATTSRNDICQNVSDFGYQFALKEFKNILTKVF